MYCSTGLSSQRRGSGCGWDYLHWSARFLGGQRRTPESPPSRVGGHVVAGNGTAPRARIAARVKRPALVVRPRTRPGAAGRYRCADPGAGAPRRGQGFRPDIGGLRAVAVLAVVLFRAAVPGIGGGFVGVDVFFVISGFLIAGLLWREAMGTGGVRLARFYGARAGRLLPPAIGAAVLLPALQAATTPWATRSPARCMSATTASRCTAPTTWPPTLPRRRSSTTGHWASRSSSTWCGRR